MTNLMIIQHEDLVGKQWQGKTKVLLSKPCVQCSTVDDKYLTPVVWSLWDLWCTRWHCDNFPSSGRTSNIPFHYPSTNERAANSFTETNVK